MFFELPHWSKLKLRHNLDVMHVEKNFFDTLMGTILDIEDKTKLVLIWKEWAYEEIYGRTWMVIKLEGI
ncbi:unnamed protein product [Prunus armeniaca]